MEVKGKLGARNQLVLWSRGDRIAPMSCERQYNLSIESTRLSRFLDDAHLSADHAGSLT